jgi:lipopolysaccharide/colanic/teichoic acid biosynthesis glycosyltransferase
VGLGGSLFWLYKLRTMRVAQGTSPSAITSKDDARVFSFGSWLRRLKVDELPQLINILKGEMTFVGPRPEDPRIVGRYYTPEQLETLSVLPGLASPGSIYSYTHGEQMLCGDDTEARYAVRLLPVKLALDTVYVREASPAYDLRVMLRAARVILGKALGESRFPVPPEMGKALRLVGPDGGAGARTAQSVEDCLR